MLAELHTTAPALVEALSVLLHSRPS
jgi:hypothetical protein